jgi:DNA-nicking Smr family endonuclease
MSEDDLFKKAVQDVSPIKRKDTVDIYSQKPKPKPIAKKLIEDEKKVLRDALSDNFESIDYFLARDELFYLKKGHSPEIIKKLRSGSWVVQNSIDLHGLTSDEAKIALVDFILFCKQKDLRCIRIIHGKGYNSKNKEPVLKNKVKKWLIQKQEVICFIQAPNYDGGSGALITLLDKN